MMWFILGYEHGYSRLLDVRRRFGLMDGYMMTDCGRIEVNG